MSGDAVAGNRIRVYRAKRRSAGSDRYNWIVDDMRGPKVFIRRFTFSFYGAAIREAHRLAADNRINPAALFGCQRIEYPR